MSRHNDPARDPLLERALRPHPEPLSLFDQPDDDQRIAALATSAHDHARAALGQLKRVEQLADALAGPGQTGHQHPETSSAAGQLDQQTARLRLLDAVRAAGPAGLTSHEAVALGAAPSVQIAGARFQELRGHRTDYDPQVGWVLEPDGTFWTRRADGTRLGARVHVALDQPLADGRTWAPDQRRAPAAPLPQQPNPTLADDGAEWVELVRSAWRLIGDLWQHLPPGQRARYAERAERWHQLATDERHQIIAPATDWWLR